MSKVMNIGARIHSTEVGNVITGANEIFDDTKHKKQDVINSEVDAELVRLDQAKQNVLTFDDTPVDGSNNPVKSDGVFAADKALSYAIEAILLLIPSAATALNQLADKNFVNSSISTATASFKGTYNLVNDLGLAVDATRSEIAEALATVIDTADENDYAFVQIPVSSDNPTEIQSTERYKFNGSAWSYEYTLNTSGFTAAQWDTINSGITQALVTKLGALPTASELAESLNRLSGEINDIKDVIPEEATSLNQLADKAYVLTQILVATPAFRGQFTTLTELVAVTGAKIGDLGIVRTKDHDGHDVFTFYQYKNDQWNEFYTLSYHPIAKPATTGVFGNYPFNGMGKIELPMNMVNGAWTDNTWVYLPRNGVVYLLYSWHLQLYAVYNIGTQEGLGLNDNLVVKDANYNINDIADIVGEHYLTFTEAGGVFTITKPDTTTITSTDLNNTTIYNYNDPSHEGVNVLTQAMLTQTNTIYVIRYDFTLTGDVTIPENCVLEFEGGSISGAYTLTGNNTGIDARLVKVFDTGVTLDGTWNVAEAYPEWFGAVKESETDSRNAIQCALNYFHKVVLNGAYTIASSDNGVGITVPIGKILEGNAGSNIRMLTDTNLCKIVATSTDIKTIIKLNRGSQIRNFAIEGYLTGDAWKTMPAESSDILVGVGVRTESGTSRLQIDGVEVSLCNIGMDLQAYLSTCKNSVCSRCTGGFYIHGSDISHFTSFVLERCYCALITKFGYNLQKMLYSSIKTCACDHFGLDESQNLIATSSFSAAYDIGNSKGISISSCGAENILAVLKVVGSSAISISNCRWQTSYNSNMTDWVFLKNNSNCVISISHEIANCPSDWKYVRIEDYNKTSGGYDIKGFSPERINIVSTGGTAVTYTDIAKYTRIYGDSVRTYSISSTQFIDSIIRSAKLFNQNTIEINAESDNIELQIDGSNQYYDSFNSTTLIINGKENGNTQLRVYSTTKHNIFNNFKNIILNNILMNYTNGRQIEGFIFRNTNVVLNNVVFRGPDSGILFISENTKVTFNNSFITNINAKYEGEVCGKTTTTNINYANHYLVKNTAVTFSNNLVGYTNDYIGRKVIFNFIESDLNAIKSKTSGLTSDEKALIKGSTGMALDSSIPYWFDGINWVDATGTPV